MPVYWKSPLADWENAETVCIIPARVESSRLLGKVLLAETGIPLFVHAAANALSTSEIDAVAVATDSLVIAEAAKQNGVSVILAEGKYCNGTERVAAAIAECFPRARMIVGLQADQPEITGKMLDALVSAHRQYPIVPLATMTRFDPPTLAELFDKDTVIAEVGVNDSVRGSMSVLSYRRGRTWEYLTPRLGGTLRVHLGVYCWWAEALRAYAKIGDGSSERIYGLEQLRVGGWPTLSVLADAPASGIDTREDYDRFVGRWKEASGS